MNNFLKKITLAIALSFTVSTNIFAVTFSEMALNLSNGIIATISKLSFGAAVVFFFWGIFMFVANADDSSKREEGKKRIIWGLIAIFVMLSVWGILSVVNNTTNLDNSHIKINFTP